MDNTIEITTTIMSFDYPTQRTYRINLDDVLGFRLHFRLGDWYITVIQKEMKSKYEHKIKDLDGCCNFADIRKILTDERCRVFNISNMHGSPNFHKDLIKVLPK